jgi:hypothetical protein
VTVRQIILANTASGGGGGGGGSGITFKGASSSAGVDSISIPSHASGDMIVIGAVGGYNLIPTAPAGWTEIRSGYTGSTSKVGYIVSRKVAASGSEVSGTWNDATDMFVSVHDGVASIGGSAAQAGTSTVTFPAVTMSVSDGSSWVVGVAIRTSVTPAEMTNRTLLAAKGSINDTSSGVSSWSAKSVFTGGITNAGITFELVSE